MIASGNAIVVASVVGHLQLELERCWKGNVAPAELIFIVVGLLSYGCPEPPIVHVFGLDERTVAHWRDRAGQQCQKVQQAVMKPRQLTLSHVQADEIRVRGKKEIFWMGLAMEVRSRLWLAGIVQATRDQLLTDRLAAPECVDAPVKPANC